MNSGIFDVVNWMFSGIDVLDGEGINIVVIIVFLVGIFSIEGGGEVVVEFEVFIVEFGECSIDVILISVI